MSLRWAIAMAALVPAIAGGGCAWASGAPSWGIILLAVSGLLSGLTGGAIVSNAYEEYLAELERRRPV